MHFNKDKVLSWKGSWKGPLYRRRFICQLRVHPLHVNPSTAGIYRGGWPKNLWATLPRFSGAWRGCLRCDSATQYYSRNLIIATILQPHAGPRGFSPITPLGIPPDPHGWESGFFRVMCGGSLGLSFQYSHTKTLQLQWKSELHDTLIMAFWGIISPDAIS